MSAGRCGDVPGAGDRTGGVPGVVGRGGTRNAAGAIRFGDVFAAELAKIRTLPVTWIALAVATAANTLLGVLAVTDAVRIAGQDGQIAIGRLGTLMVSPVYVFAAIAVHAAGGEYRAGQLRVTLAAVPDRNRLFTAKLAATAAAGLLAAIPAVLPGHLVRHAPAIAGGHLGIGAAAAGLAAILGAYLLLGLIGHGLAVIARSVVTPLAVLLVTPVVISPALRGTLPDLVRFLPHEATLSLLDMAGDPGAALGRAGGLLVLTAWAGLSVGGAWLVFARRDV
ncbi:ABC transporter [Streptosporangium sp. OZ121]|uniref:ABC transporter n=1 Tax=Streptosporangium sp. OZ121 TaxID=3444183 RepID=UPI003F7A9A23